MTIDTDTAPKTGPMLHERRPFPTFATPDEERTFIRQRLAASYRIFSKFGFDDGVAGHITAKDPVDEDHFYVCPFTVSFSQIKASDIIKVDAGGNVVGAAWRVNAAGFAIHARIHEARPDAKAAAHSHSPWGRAFSALGRKLQPITQSSCAFYNDHEILEEYTGVVLDPAEGDKIAATLGGAKGIILQNHGLITVGTTIDSALWWYVTMEMSCETQMRADAAGTPIPIPDEYAQLTSDQIGNEIAGWVQAQPLFDMIIAEQPDLLD